MLPTTMQAVRSILTADPSVNPPERKRLMSVMRQGPEAKSTPTAAPTGPRILRRREAAARFSVSIRCVDAWAKKGILKKRILPGHIRASGFLSSEIDRLLAGEVSHG